MMVTDQLKNSKLMKASIAQVQLCLTTLSHEKQVITLLERIENALEALFYGLIMQRQQIDDGVAVDVDVAGHSLSVRARKKR